MSTVSECIEPQYEKKGKYVFGLLQISYKIFMNKRILITGASGFIGTNLLEHFIVNGFTVCNVDFNPPKISKRKDVWKNVDITDFPNFKKEVIQFQPDYIVHLAARTDLDGKTLEEYKANINGVENLMEIIKELPNLKKIIIASSKFVTPNGYIIRDQFDYCPHTVYGESKVMTEKIVWSNQPSCDWCIVRPTSIWGPWFGVPYRNFFDLILKKMYFHIGNIKCHKTYGFVGNTVYQIEMLLFGDTKNHQNKIFYLGDEPAYEINEWADEIAQEIGFKIPTVPVSIVRLLAKIGDFLSYFGIHFPMQSFRFKNMTNDGINNLESIRSIAPKKVYSRIEANRITLDWLKKEKRKNND